MPPKGKQPAAANPADTVASAVAKLGAEDLSYADLAGPLTELSAAAAEAGGVDALVKQMGALLPPIASCLATQVAAIPATELTAGHVAAVGAAAQLVRTLVSTDASGALCSVEFVALFLSLLLPGPEEDAEWNELGEPSARAQCARHACAAIAAIASLPEGCARVRHGAMAPLLTILVERNSVVPALQSQAAAALAACLGSTLGRIQMRGIGADLDHLLELASPPPAGASLEGIQLRAQAVLVLAQCMLDPVLRGSLLQMDLMGRALATLQLRPPDAPSPDMSAATAELQSNAASLLAIAGQAEQGRRRLMDAAAPAPLLRILTLDAAVAGAPPRQPPSIPLLANTALAVAHLALLPAAAEALGAPAVPLLLNLLSKTPPDALAGQSAGWDALRGNACAALASLLVLPAVAEQLLADDAAGVRALAAMLVDADSAASLRTAASDVLGRVALSEAGRAAVLGAAADAVAALLARVQEQEAESPDEVESALCSLAALAAHESVRRMLRAETEPPAEGAADAPPAAEEGEAPPPPMAGLVSLLGYDSPSLRRAAACAIAAACHGSDRASAELLVAWGAVDALTAVRKEPDSGAAAAAASALRAVCLALPSAMFWLTAEVPLGVALGEGFCSVPADSSFGDLAALRAMHADDPGADVLVVSDEDAGLAELAARARPLVDAAATPADAAAALAGLVSSAMGGSVGYHEYESFDASAVSSALRARNGSRAVPIGGLTKGGARARAVLFKALADRCGLAAGLGRGRCVAGAHAHHAWAVVAMADELAVVDLLHSPGELLPLGSDAALRYQRVREYAFSSLASTRAAPFEVAKKLVVA